jgi:hypothetical protein
MSPAFLSQDPLPLMEIIRKLELRVRKLEKILELSKDGLHLSSGSSSIQVSPKKIVISAHDIEIRGAGRVSVKAGGDLVLKGSKVVNN